MEYSIEYKNRLKPPATLNRTVLYWTFFILHYIIFGTFCIGLFCICTINNNNQRGKLKNNGTGFFKNNHNNKNSNNNRQQAKAEEYNQAITVDEAYTITVQQAEKFSNAEITLKTIT